MTGSGARCRLHVVRDEAGTFPDGKGTGRVPISSMPEWRPGMRAGGRSNIGRLATPTPKGCPPGVNERLAPDCGSVQRAVPASYSLRLSSSDLQPRAATLWDRHPSGGAMRVADIMQTNLETIGTDDAVEA